MSTNKIDEVKKEDDKDEEKDDHKDSQGHEDEKKRTMERGKV